MRIDNGSCGVISEGPLKVLIFISCYAKKYVIYEALDRLVYRVQETKAHIPLKTAFASANFRVANAENDAQTT